MARRFFKKPRIGELQNVQVIEINLDNKNNTAVSLAISEAIRLGKKNYLIKNNEDSVKVYIW